MTDIQVAQAIVNAYNEAQSLGVTITCWYPGNDPPEEQNWCNLKITPIRPGIPTRGMVSTATTAMSITSANRSRGT